MTPKHCVDDKKGEGPAWKETKPIQEKKRDNAEEKVRKELPCKGRGRGTLEGRKRLQRFGERKIQQKTFPGKKRVSETVQMDGPIKKKRIRKIFGERGRFQRIVGDFLKGRGI